MILSLDDKVNGCNLGYILLSCILLYSLLTLVARSAINWKKSVKFSFVSDVFFSRIISRGKHLLKLFTKYLFNEGILQRFPVSGSTYDILISLTPAVTILRFFVNVALSIEIEISAD